MEDGGHVDVAKDKRIPADVGLELYMLRRVSFYNVVCCELEVYMGVGSML